MILFRILRTVAVVLAAVFVALLLNAMAIHLYLHW